MGTFIDPLQVDPVVLNTVAGKAYQKIIALENDFGELESLIKKTDAYWKGNGGDSFRMFYASEKEDIMQGIKGMKSDMENLYTISAQYSKTEKDLTDIAMTLPGDVIS